MLSEKMQAALNEQLNAELYSSYLYLSMAAYCHAANLQGFAGWMQVQAREELTHAAKLFGHLAARGRVRLGPIDEPPRDWQSGRDVFEATLRHEQKVTGLVNSLVELAAQENDEGTGAFLEWFVDEQEEEEESAQRVLQKMSDAANDAAKMVEIDRELGRRTFSPPKG